MHSWVATATGRRCTALTASAKLLVQQGPIALHSSHVPTRLSSSAVELIQDVLEEIDPTLEPVLAKSFIKRGNAILNKLGDKEVDYNPDFRLYVTTKMGALPPIRPCVVLFNSCSTQCLQRHWCLCCAA